MDDALPIFMMNPFFRLGVDRSGGGRASTACLPSASTACGELKM